MSRAEETKKYSKQTVGNTSNNSGAFLPKASMIGSKDHGLCKLLPP